MNTCGGSLRAEQQTLPFAGGGSNPTPPLHIKARDLLISACGVLDVRLFLETNHYSHSINGVKIAQCFKVEYQGFLVGAALFGAMSTTAWKKFADCEKKVLELRRLVLIDNAGKNSESRVIGWCLQYIKKNMTNVEVVVSYADPYYNHRGTIYKAANFEYLGLSGKDKGYLDKETGKIYHSRALRTKYKGNYKPFVKKLREKLDKGILTPIELPQKHCYIFRFNSSTRGPEPSSVVGSTPRARKSEQRRMEIIVEYCGCLPCLLTGHLDVHTSIEHVTERGRRVGKGAEQHEWTIGLCTWHHFGWTRTRETRQQVSGERGPSLIWGRILFEEHFGDEVHVLVPTQNFMLELFDTRPWPEYAVPRDVARKVRAKWIELNHASEP